MQEDTDGDNMGDNCDLDDDNDGRYDYLVGTVKLTLKSSLFWTWNSNVVLVQMFNKII